MKLGPGLAVSIIILIALLFLALLGMKLHLIHIPPHYDPFVPPDLPLMLRWRSGRCAQAALVLDIQPVPEAGHQHLQQRELIVQDDQLIDPADGSISRVPDLWQSLLRAGAGMLRST